MKKRNKKIGIFTGYYLPKVGGVERYTNKLATEFKKNGYDVVIITSQYTNLPNEETQDFKIYRLPVFNLFRNRYPLIKKNEKFKELEQKIIDEKFDFILCQTRFHLTSYVGCKIAYKYNIPMMLLDHGSNHFTVNNKILDYFGAKYEHWLTNKIKKMNHNFYGVSKRCTEWLKHFDINARGVIYNSIDGQDAEKYKNKKFEIEGCNLKNKTVITYAGRLIKEKGILLLMDSFNTLKKKNKNIILLIAGDGPLKNEILNSCDGNNIIYVGKLNYDQVMSLYNITDIFVYPSMFPEGLPTGILEAGIMNCAVVATDRGGTIEVINDDKYGLICKENITDLTNKLQLFLDNPKKISECKINLHDRVLNNFTWNVTAKHAMEEMEKIMNEKN